MANQKKKLLILSGCADISIVAANRYMRDLSAHFDVTLIEEQTPFLQRLLRFIRRRYRLTGLLSTLGALAFRVRMMLFATASLSEDKTYTPDMVVPSVNDAQVAKWIADNQPDIIMANACLLIREPVLSAAAGIPMFNLHNGINPRYRGNGNFWAFHEGHYEMAGITIHHIDAGVDTGGRIIAQPLDFKGDHVPFDEIDVYAFIKGAQAMIAFLVDGQRGIAPQFSNVLDGSYRYPTLPDYYTARRHYTTMMTQSEKAETTWQASFETQALDEGTPIYQRMHWHDDSTVDARDTWVRGVIDQAMPNKTDQAVLDIGCGDGRMQDWFVGAHYTGCDYSPNTLNLADQQRVMVAGSADALPIQSHSQDLVFSVGLLQHLSQLQPAADEMRRVARPDSVIVINTLRQFSALELLVIAGLSFYNLPRLRLVWHIWRRNYGRGVVLDGVLLARRTNRREIARAFKVPQSAVKIAYNGIGGTCLMARELTATIHLHA